MCSLTYLTFWALIAGITIGSGAIIWWVRHEVARVDRRIDMHDERATDTATAISQMSTDIAVLRKSVENIEADGQETKKSIAEINRTLFNTLKER